jgi:virulence-associated protein VagC
MGQWSWANRHDLLCGAPKGEYRISISPQGGTFYVYPQVTSTDKLEVFYDGVKKSFIDTDVVTFDEPSLEVVADFVKAKIAREVDHDLAMHDSYWASFLRNRSMLELNTRERVSMKYTFGSALPDSHYGYVSDPCGDADDDTTTSGCQGTTYSCTT